jgi:hypothetical protein
MDAIITAYEIDTRSFKLRLKRDDLRMGLSMVGEIDDALGQSWATCRFVTSPDFPQFEEFQLLPSHELAAKAVEILLDGGHEDVAKARLSGLIVNFRMNARGQA